MAKCRGLKEQLPSAIAWPGHATPGPRPTLQQPFWRYHIHTAEPDGQFELLLKAEQDGADVFYLAPKFHDRKIYLDAFENRRIV
jgi:hypothetical protein